jgi:hypothetical protein
MCVLAFAPSLKKMIESAKLILDRELSAPKHRNW